MDHIKHESTKTKKYVLEVFGNAYWMVLTIRRNNEFEFYL